MRKLLTILCLAPAFLIFNNSFAQDLIEVTASNNVYTPANISINVGDTVRWTNIEGTHNVNGSTATFASNPESFSSGSPATGWVFDHVFTTAGSYDYRCDLHFGVGMVGTVTVAAPSGDNELIEDDNISKVNLYPMPATNFIKVEIAEKLLLNKNVSIHITDIMGKVVIEEENVVNPSIKYDISMWPGGIYIFQIAHESKIIETKKIVVDR